MNKSMRLCFAVIAFAYCCNPAKADDVSSDWSGPYIGLNAGFGATDYRFGETIANDTAPTITMNGPMGGGTLGYNWNINDIVLGVEADIAITGIQGGFQNSLGYGCDPDCHNKLDMFGTGRLRIGKPIGNIMPFLTAGIAWGRVIADSGDNPGYFVNGIAQGWTFGGGVETALNAHLTAKIETLYTDFTKFTSPGGVWVKDSNFLVARIGVNYKF
jgi:outer membrane immunogenic protein